MSIVFDCPQCATQNEFADRFAGCVDVCSHCGRNLIVPTASSSETAAEAAPAKPRRRTRLIKGVAVTVGLCALIAILRIETYRPCGHPRTVWDRIKPIQATHCCEAALLVQHKLRVLWQEQRRYHRTNGRFADSFQTLKAERRIDALDEIMDDLVATGAALTASDDDWQCFVPHSDRRPGSYRLTSDGRVHFTPVEAAHGESRVTVDFSRHR